MSAILGGLEWPLPVWGPGVGKDSALAGLEARIALADHEQLAAATHNLAIRMA